MWNMSKKLGCKSKSLSYILTNGQGVTELLKYIGRTKLFKYIFGEVDPAI
jgi:hypothetical protein